MPHAMQRGPKKKKSKVKLRRMEIIKIIKEINAIENRHGMIKEKEETQLFMEIMGQRRGR